MSKSFAPSSKLAFALAITMVAMVGCGYTGEKSASAVTPLYTQAPAPIAQEANTQTHMVALMPDLSSFSWPKAMEGTN